MKILLSWSSGKDSAWALHVLNQTHPGAVAALLTTVNEAVDRVAMHGVRRAVLEAQAAAAALPLRTVPIPELCPNETYEARMRIAVENAVRSGATARSAWPAAASSRCFRCGARRRGSLRSR
jgi:diphthamide synthase (EF-2-diphthine--ammonia ligase)